MAATLVAVSTSTRRRAAGWASGATCRLLEWRRGGWGRGCSTGVDPLAGSSAVCLYTTVMLQAQDGDSAAPCNSCHFEAEVSVICENLRLKSQHVMILSVHHKEDGASQHLRTRLMNLRRHRHLAEPVLQHASMHNQMAASIYSRQTAQ